MPTEPKEKNKNHSVMSITLLIPFLLLTAVAASVLVYEHQAGKKQEEREHAYLGLILSASQTIDRIVYTELIGLSYGVEMRWQIPSVIEDLHSFRNTLTQISLTPEGGAYNRRGMFPASERGVFDVLMSAIDFAIIFLEHRFREPALQVVVLAPEKNDDLRETVRKEAAASFQKLLAEVDALLEMIPHLNVEGESAFPRYLMRRQDASLF